MPCTSNTDNNTNLIKISGISAGLTVITLLIIAITATVAFCEVTPGDITSVLPENLDHPYLFSPMKISRLSSNE